MEETQVQLPVMAVQGAEESNPLEIHNAFTNPKTVNHRRRWFKIALYIIFVLLGQSAATLLGRLYFDKGGNSKWLATVVQLVGFPVLLPYYLLRTSSSPPKTNTIPSQPSPLVLAFVYVSLGLLVALDCYLYSVGLMYLPVSTYSLICSSQLAFNAFFSFFFNNLKFTPFIINSLVLLTISSTLLAFQPDDSGDSAGVSKGKYVIGFLCTVGASAGYGLVLSLTQLAFTKVLKKETFKVIMDMIIYQCLSATCATLVGLFASGEWKGLKREMEEYELGKASYVLNLTWTAITWQLFNIGCVGLIMDVSSLFSNAISVLSLPIVPIMAVFLYHDKLNGIKGISMALAVWGFVSYVYQHYLDDLRSKAGNSDVQKASLSDEVNGYI
ncbi:hypothetical protein L6164_035448 [Bauhinia variegata]|uniref:Uncharacterized protein n=1 Tax=Bauhinia variegata TaxID=167791 RepID=A0ACB9KE15_BAUVA|nr:hypothetical protein L6164_035448 [Bauhinia variegata]